MTNEAVLIFETEIPIPFTVSDSTGIEKGTILKLADPRTVSAASGTDDIVGGILATEKIASDGKVSKGVYRHGIFKVIASGAITVGDDLGIAGVGSENYVFSHNTAGTVNISGCRSIGIALETAADEETFLMELNPSVTWGIVT